MPVSYSLYLRLESTIISRWRNTGRVINSAALNLLIGILRPQIIFENLILIKLTRGRSYYESNINNRQKALAVR